MAPASSKSLRRPAASLLASRSWISKQRKEHLSRGTFAVSVNGLRTNQEKLVLPGYARRGFERSLEFVFFHWRRAGRSGCGNSPRNGLDYRRRRAIGVSLARKSAISLGER
jgi:hypothetical protein